MFKFFDDLYVAFWHWVLVRLCKLTGRDNFFFAICALLLMDFLLIAGVMLEMTRSPMMGGMLTLSTAVCLYASFIVIKAAGAFREMVSNNQGQAILEAMQREKTLSQCAGVFYSVAVLIPFVVVLNAQPVVQGLFAGFAIYLSAAWPLAIAMTFALDFQSPGKKLGKKVRDWLKAHKPQFAWGGTAPHPVPS